jgi:hypothetical protein
MRSVSQRTWQRWCATALRVLPLLLALNYFAFRVELCEEENLQHHPERGAGCSLTMPSVDWETFDKENAPEALVVDASIGFELVGPVIAPRREPFQYFRPFRLIQDKSPPASFHAL